MSDILFNCSDCDAPLAVDGDMAGTVMKCPGCGKGIGVPKPDVEFKCAKCGHAHQAPEWATGKPFTCVGCEAELHIPTPGFAAEGVVGARRIHRFATPPREPATVAPQAQFPPVGHSFRANRVREGREFPIDKQTVKVAVYALIGIVVIAVFGNPLKWEVWKYLRKGDDKAATNKVAVAVAPPAVVKTNQFWKAAHTNLCNLARNPRTPGGIDKLEVDIARLWDGDRDTAVPLAVAYAMLRLDIEQDAGGCLWMESHMPGTDAAKRCAKANFYSPCQTCKQTGETRNSCTQCKDGKCRTCDGKGKEKRVKQPPKRLTPVQLGGGGRGKKLGEAPAPRAEAPVETWVPCAACGGATKCAACEGKGFTVKSCYACRGGKCVYNPGAATRHREEAVAAALKVASARLLSEDEPPPPPLDPNAFLVSFGANAAADLKRLQEVLKGNEVSLWDAIMLYSTSTPDDTLSIDIDVSDILVDTAVPRSKVSPLDKVTLIRLLESKGLVLKDAKLPDGTAVRFVSSPAACAYLAACAQARARQYDEVMRTLAAARHEQSAMGRQAAGLHKVVEAMTKDWQTLNNLRNEARIASTDFAKAVKQSEMIRNTPVVESRANIKLGDLREINRHNAESRLATARERLLKARMSFDELIRKTNESHDLILDRLDECYKENISSEGVMLVEYLNSTLALVVDAANGIQETGVTDGKPLLTDSTMELPVFYRRIQDALKKASEDSVLIGGEGEKAEGEVRMRKLGTAVALDRCNASAKVAFGHEFFLGRRRIMSDTLLAGNKPEVIAKFGRQLSERQKRSASAVYDHVNEGGMLRSVDIPMVEGRINGLAICRGVVGEVYPLNVHITSVVPQRLLLTEETLGWYGSTTRRFETWTKSFPISFGDYGGKDMFTVIAAIESWKWLQYRYLQASTNRQDKEAGIHIELSDLTGGLGGDSAGAAFGVAAWSAWSKTPILQNVAMTGAIRSDGSVTAVGAVRMKVAAALSGKGIETVIVPKANVSDLANMSFEDLCAIAVVTADNMDTCLAYATGTGEAAKAIPPLRKAQMLAFLGRRKEAWDILLPLVARHPELYSARRLAEVLITYDPKLAEAGAK